MTRHPLSFLLPVFLLTCIFPGDLPGQTRPPGVPESATHYQGRWYEALHSADIKPGNKGLLWTEAQTLAESRGGNLASIETAIEHEFIRSLLLQWPNDEFWVGGYFTGRDWRWLNGTKINRARPDDFETSRRLRITGAKGGRKLMGHFARVPMAGFVVEYAPDNTEKITLPPLPWSSDHFPITDAARPPGIPDSAIHFNGHWYDILSEKSDGPALKGISWQDAHELAVKRGGHLVCIESAGERDFLFHLLKDDPKIQFWTGGYRAKPAWRWINGAPFRKEAAPIGTGKETTRRVFFTTLKEKDIRHFNGDPKSGSKVDGMVIEYTPGETVAFQLPGSTPPPAAPSKPASPTPKNFSNGAVSGSDFANALKIQSKQARVNGLLIMDLGAKLAGSASPMSMIALAGEPDTSAVLQFNQPVGPSMQTALAEVAKFIEVRHSGWPRGHTFEISFENKYNPKDGPSAAVACALLLESTITGTKLDPGFAVTGDLNADGSVQPIGGVEAKIRGATSEQCTHIAIPKNNTSAVYDTILMDGIAPAINIQIFSIATFEEAYAIASSTKSASVQKSLSEFSEIQEIYRKQPSGFSQVVRHPKVIEKLEGIVEVMPNHLSSSLLLDFAKGTAPTSLSLQGSFSFIDENAYQIVDVIKDGKVAKLDDFDEDQVAEALSLLRRSKLKLDQRTWDWADGLLRWGELMREYQTNRPKAISNVNKMISDINTAGNATRAERVRLLEDPEIVEELLE